MNHKHKPQIATVLQFDEENWSRHKHFCFCDKRNHCRYCGQPICLKRPWLVKLITFALLLLTPIIVLLPVNPASQTILDVIKIIYLLTGSVYLWKGGLLFQWKLSDCPHQPVEDGSLIDN